MVLSSQNLSIQVRQNRNFLNQDFPNQDFSNQDFVPVKGKGWPQIRVI